MRISDWSSGVCSSDLADLPVGNEWLWPSATSRSGHIEEPKENGLPSPHEYRHHARTLFIASGVPYAERSEEHTSELQSLMRISYAVFCLKKKTKQQRNTTEN